HLHRIGNRKGAIIELPSDRALLLEKPYYHFLETVHNRPQGEEWYQQMTYVAQVKKEAKSLGIRLNDYLEREEYEFIDEVDVSLERDEKGIEIVPEYKHVNLDENLLSDMSASNKNYIKSGKKRVFVSEDTLAAKDKAERVPKIRNEDIPK